MSGVDEAMTMAASTKSLFRRGVGKRISRAAIFLGRAIRVSASDRDRALSKFSYEVSEELRTLNCTLAAIAISDNHEGARSYLERVVERGIVAYDERTRHEDRVADLDRRLRQARTPSY